MPQSEDLWSPCRDDQLRGHPALHQRDGQISYGGGFTAYEAAVRAEQEVAEKNVRTAEQEVKREKRD